MVFAYRPIRKINTDIIAIVSVDYAKNYVERSIYIMYLLTNFNCID